MNYEKHYNLLIERARNRLLEGYIERHHVIPRCIGGDDSEDNIVELTAREHYVAHQLLVKMHPGNRKLVYAMASMANLHVNGKRANNKLYSWVKQKLSKAQSERRMGKTLEELYDAETAARIRKGRSERMEGNTIGVGREPWNKGKKWSKEIRKKMSASAKGRKNPAAAKAKRKAVIIDDVEYPSCKQAAKELGLHHNTITRMIKRNEAVVA